MPRQEWVSLGAASRAGARDCRPRPRDGVHQRDTCVAAREPTELAIDRADAITGHDLQRQGKRVVLTRQVGQVGGILTPEQRPAAIEIYPSVRRAVEALRVKDQTQR